MSVLATSTAGKDWDKRFVRCKATGILQASFIWTVISRTEIWPGSTTRVTAWFIRIVGKALASPCWRQCLPVCRSLLRQEEPLMTLLMTKQDFASRRTGRSSVIELLDNSTQLGIFGFWNQRKRRSRIS